MLSAYTNETSKKFQSRIVFSVIAQVEDTIDMEHLPLHGPLPIAPKINMIQIFEDL